jgi:tripartite-type tricarboxylate transporter receptor subunit TctC
MGNRKKVAILLIGISSIFFILSVPFHALCAGFPEDGKNIRFVIPYGPGGGMDLYPRTLFPFLKQYLTWKNGEIVPENLDAAAGITGSREIFFSKPDGYTIGIIYTRAVLFPQLVGQVQKFDMSKFTYLGQFNDFPSGVWTSGKHPFLKSASDLKNPPRPLTLALPTLGEIGTYWMLKDKMKINVKPILGFKGSREAIMAVVQGEVDLTTNEFSTMASLYKSGDSRILFHFGAKPLREAPSVPSLKDLGYEEFAGKITVDRTLVGPPGIPKDRVEVLRQAIWKALSDPKYMELSEKAQRFLDIDNGENAEKSSLAIIDFWTKNEESLKKAMVEAGFQK